MKIKVVFSMAFNKDQPQAEEGKWATCHFDDVYEQTMEMIPADDAFKIMQEVIKAFNQFNK